MPEILSATVFASMITSVVNVIISLLNNYRLKSIEARKRRNEIDKYRYIQLYEILKNWEGHKLRLDKGEELDDKKLLYATEEALLEAINNNSFRYVVIRPLLDTKYIDDLDRQASELSDLQIKLDMEKIALNEYQVLQNKYLDVGGKFSEMLRDSVNSQLRDLM